MLYSPCTSCRPGPGESAAGTPLSTSPYLAAATEGWNCTPVSRPPHLYNSDCYLPRCRQFNDFSKINVLKEGPMKQTLLYFS